MSKGIFYSFQRHMMPHSVLLLNFINFIFMWTLITVRWNPRDKRAFRMNHPISSASFNLKGCNLVCGSRWPKSTLTRNFSPIGPVVPEIWPNMWKNSQKKREKEKVLKMTKNSRKNGHYSKSTGPNQLKFCLAIDFGHRVPQTKFWLDCLKST